MRTKLDCNQTTFAKKLGCSSMSVSRWERGLLKPPPAYLIALGEMAGPPVGLQFWKMAGINPNSVKRMLSATQKGRKQDPKRS